MKRLFFIFLLLLASLNVVYAKDIVMAINQSDYYFLVGEDSFVPLEMDNSYGKAIDGMLSYTLTQQISQGGFSYSSSNSQSKSFSVPDGKNIINLGFGSSDSPTTLKAKLSFSYTEKEQRIVNLNEITIHFVEDEKQKQNKENKQQSSSQTQQQNQQQSQQNQNSMQQQMQQMQEEMDKMLNNRPQQQNTQQKLQNNQMQQDSGALKQQMQKQMEEQQQMKEEFQKQLSQNQDFQKEHQELLKQGYNLTSGNLNPASNNTGEFQLNYEKNGETASLKGSMNNGTMENIEKTSSRDIQDIMDKLKQNSDYQKYDKKLNDSNFKQMPPELTREGNQTTVKINYQNDRNETAAITAKIEQDEVKEVKLEKENSKRWILYLFIFIIIVILGYFIYKKYHKKKHIQEETKKTIEKPIDYRKEALKLLLESKSLFLEKKEKDAYGKASEAIRFYYSYKLGLKKELNNSELIKLLKSNKINYTETQKCLNLCGLVEFAKYKANKEDFDEIISLAEKIIV